MKFDDLIGNYDVAIHCKTKKDIKDFIRYCKNNNIDLQDNGKLVQTHNDCFMINSRRQLFRESEFYCKHYGYKIIDFKDLELEVN